LEARRYWTQLFTVSRTDGPRALTFMKPAAVIVRVIRVGEAQELEPPVADGEAVIASTPHLTSAVLIYERQEVACLPRFHVLGAGGTPIQWVGSSSIVSVAKSSQRPSKNTPICQPPCSGQNSRSGRSGSSLGAVAIGLAAGEPSAMRELHTNAQ